MHFCCKILDMVVWVLVSSIGKIPCLLLIKKKKKNPLSSNKRSRVQTLAIPKTNWYHGLKIKNNHHGVDAIV